MLQARSAALALLIGVVMASACGRTDLSVGVAGEGDNDGFSGHAGAPAAPPRDATVVRDAERQPDAEPPPDAEPAPDAEPPPDAQTRPDAEHPPDAEPPPDASVDVEPPDDAGPDADSAPDSPPTQPLQWTRAFLGDDRCGGAGVAVATDGSVYVTGWFQGAVDFDPGPGVESHTSEGTAIFLTKLAPDGSHVWTRSWSGNAAVSPGWGDEGRSVAVAGDGSVVVGGEYTGTVDFDPGPGIDEHTVVGAFDAFVTRLRADGSYVWTRTWGSAMRDRAFQVATAPDGTLYVSGQFEQSADLDPGPDERWYAANGEVDCYLMKLDAAGELVWVRTWGGADVEYSCGVAAGSDNSAISAGEFQLTADFDPGPGTDYRTSAGHDDAFVLKLLSDGTRDWARTWGGTSTETVKDVALASDDSVLVSGSFYAPADFDPSGSEDWHEPQGQYDAFVTHLSAEGAYEWTRTWGGDGRVSAGSVVARPDRIILSSGSFQGSIDFDPGTPANLHTSAGDYDVFVSALGSDGTYLWTAVVGGPEHDYAYDLVSDGDVVVVAGTFRETVDFDFGSHSEVWTAPALTTGCFVSRFVLPGP